MVSQNTFNFLFNSLKNQNLHQKAQIESLNQQEMAWVNWKRVNSSNIQQFITKTAFKSSIFPVEMFRRSSNQLSLNRITYGCFSSISNITIIPKDKSKWRDNRKIRASLVHCKRRYVYLKHKQCESLSYQDLVNDRSNWILTINN